VDYPQSKKDPGDQVMMVLSKDEQNSKKEQCR